MSEDQDKLVGSGHANKSFVDLLNDKRDESKMDSNKSLVMEAIQSFKKLSKRKLATIRMTYDGEEMEGSMADGKEEEPAVEGAEQKEDDGGEIKVKGIKAQRLNEAVMAGDFTKVMRLLDQKVDVNTADSFGRTPLQNAILKGDVRLVDALLDNKADVTHRDDRGDTPMHFAARSGNEKILQSLLRSSDEVNIVGSSGYTPLHIAANLNKPNLCKILLEHRANFDSREDSGKVPLGKAMESGAAKSAKFLLQYVNENQMDLQSYLSDGDTDGNTLLHLAVDSGFLQVVEICLEYGARIRQPKRHDRSTAFHLACEQGATEIVELFLQRDPGVGKILLVDSKGTTPLHKAARTNNPAILNLLIEQGANVNARSNDNVTPLMMASSVGATESVRLLMEKGADTTVKDVDGRTAVYNAVGYGGTMAVLLEDHALVPLLTEKDASGYAPPHYAAQRGDIKSITLFLAHNKSAATVLSDGQDTPLHVAARFGWDGIARSLLEKQGNKIVNLQNNRSRTALHFAGSGGYHKVVNVLLDYGATIEKDQSGRTPLHEAAKKGAKKASESIVNNHLHCLNAVDDEKNTALHVAANHNHAHIVTFLLSVNEQEILMNSSNQNVLDLAMDQDLRDVSMAIADHDRWREILGSCNAGVPRQMIRLVEKMPLVAERIFDQCIETEGDSMNIDYKVTYDMTVALCKSNPQVPSEKGTLAILQTVASKRRERLLRHPLCFTIISGKWNSFGYLAFLFNLCFFLLYLMPLTYLHVHLRDNDDKYCDVFANETIFSEESARWCLRRYTSMQVLQIFTATLTGIMFLKELVQLIREFKRYLLSVVNWIEMIAQGAAIFSVIPLCECKWGSQKVAAAVALFFGWISLILYIQRLPAYGKYIIMLQKMFITLIKVLLIFVLFVFAFGIVFYLLIYDENFADLPNTLLEMFVMTLGELNYGDKFRPWTNLYYPYLLNILFLLFSLTLPIILMNMLVGLSVGDIDAILESALLDRYCLQIELLNEIETSLPAFLLRRVLVYKHVEFPNQSISFPKSVFNALIGFGDFEEPESDDNETKVAIATLTEKLEEHTNEIEEMHSTMKQMFQLLKEREENGK